jgi:hypothetical protein
MVIQQVHPETVMNGEELKSFIGRPGHSPGNW